MNKLKLIICRRLPGSGKTTYSRQWVNESPKERIRVNRDDIRRLVGPYWIPTREDLITDIKKQMIISGIDNKYSVIIDATNFRKNVWESFAYNNHLNCDIEYKDFTDISVEQCVVNDLKRSKEEQVGRIVIENMYNKYLK